MSIIIPSRSREIRELRNKEIRALYKIGYTMEEICRKVNVSKTTVFFALKGRAPKKRDIILKTKGRNKNNNNHNHNHE